MCALVTGVQTCALPICNVERDALEANKSDIGWGSQIRNYVLDQSRIKDLRTGIERSDTQKVLDGDLVEFVEASLKSGLEAGPKRAAADSPASVGATPPTPCDHRQRSSAKRREGKECVDMLKD